MGPEIHLAKKALSHVRKLMETHLAPTMVFHNLKHTLEVYAAVVEIALSEKLSLDEFIIVQMAAIFHDCGYLFAYKDHEDVSMAIAGTYLVQEGWDDDDVTLVTECIAATKLPQSPQNMIQSILCDADMCHLASKNYLDHADRLRKEWEVHLHKKYDTPTWDRSNLALLTAHTYFTTYAQAKWEPLKQQNIERLEKQIAS